MFPLHHIAHVGVSQSRGLKLFGREVILEEFQRMTYHNMTLICFYNSLPG